MKAYRFEYFLRRLLIGGPDPDREITFPSVGVYVPERDVFVNRDPRSDCYAGPPSDICQIIIGDRARIEYEQILAGLRSKGGGVKVEEVEVHENFIAWAEASHRFRNPSQDITDLLKHRGI